MFISTYRAIRSAIGRALLEAHRRSILKTVQGGEGLHLDGKILLVHGENLTLGRNVHIGHDARLNCLGGITIGDHTVISGHCTIYSYNHVFKHPTTLPVDTGIVRKPVHIGRYIWIGINVTIAPGTVIEDGAVIGMGTVVSGHVAANSIVVSPKPRVVGYRDCDFTSALAERGMFYQRAA